MDQAERARLKQLANDSVIATFGCDNTESRLALALESAVEEFEFIATGCDHCKYCDIHGETDDDGILVNVNEIVRIHGELKKTMQALKDYHVRLSGDLAEWETTGELGTSLAEDLAEIIEETQGYVDELEAEVTP